MEDARERKSKGQGKEIKIIEVGIDTQQTIENPLANLSDIIKCLFQLKYLQCNGQWLRLS